MVGRISQNMVKLSINRLHKLLTRRVIMFTKNDELVPANSLGGFGALDKILFNNVNNVGELIRFNMEMWQRSVQSASDIVNAISTSTNPADIIKLLNEWQNNSMLDCFEYFNGLNAISNKQVDAISKKEINTKGNGLADKVASKPAVTAPKGTKKAKSSLESAPATSQIKPDKPSNTK